MEMPLRDVFKSIVQNEYIRESIKEVYGNENSNLALQEHPKYKAYKVFVDYQIKQYKSKHPTLTPIQAFGLEGFQGGVPWVGDLKNAPVLFLSSNPAFTYNQCTPRYHAGADNWTIYKKADNNDQVCKESIDFDGVWNFFTYPLCKTKNPLGSLMAIKNPDGLNPLLTVNIFDGNRIKLKARGVQFWNKLVRKVLVKFSSSRKLLNRNINAGNLTKTDLTELVNKAVFTEIVPFQSLNQEGVNNASVNYCWEDFSKEILCHSAAKLWIIVGSHARDKLSGLMQNGGGNVFSNVERFKNGSWIQGQNGNMLSLDTGCIFRLNYNGQSRTLWIIPHPNVRPKDEDHISYMFVDESKVIPPINWAMLEDSI